MQARPSPNPSLSDLIFEKIASAILSGNYQPGTWLPPERALTEQLGVNRHVVREALKRLAQIGLIRVSPGGGSQVLDFKRHAGMDLLVLMAQHQGQAGPDVATTWLSVLEMRAAIAADAARLCALRADRKLKTELLELGHALEHPDATSSVLALEVKFWEKVIDGSQNLAYRLGFNTMLKGTQALGELGEHWARAEVRGGSRGEIAEAIAAGDSTKAELLTRDAMRKTLSEGVGIVAQPRVVEQTNSLSGQIFEPIKRRTVKARAPKKASRA